MSKTIEQSLLSVFLMVFLISSCAESYPPEGSIWVGLGSAVPNGLCYGCQCASYTEKIIIYDMKEKKVIYSHSYTEPLYINDLPVGTELEIRYQNIQCIGLVYPPTNPITTCTRTITAPDNKVVLPKGEGIYAPMRPTCL